MKEQLKLCPILNHDTESIQEKTRKKISEKEKKEQGDSIAEKSRLQVEAIIDDIHKKDTSLDKWQLKKKG